MPLKMGYIGCGFIAQKVHIPNLAALPEFELVALAEVRGGLGRRVQARYGVPRLYRDHYELAEDPEVGAVGVSAAFHQQGEIAADLLRAGKHVFMEKPLAVSVEQAERIVAAEQASGKRLMVGYMKRYDGGNIAAKEFADDARHTSALGRLLYVRNHGFCGDWTAGAEYTPIERSESPYVRGELVYPTWLPAEFRDGYIAYLQQWIHNVNLVRWILDANGDVEVRGVDLDKSDGCTGVVVLGVAGTRVVMETANVEYHGWDEHTEIYFERGRVKLTSPPLLVRGLPASVEIYRAAERTTCQLFPNTGWTWSFAEELKHFADCLQHDHAFRTPASDAAADIRVIEEIYRAHIGATEARCSRWSGGGKDDLSPRRGVASGTPGAAVLLGGD